MCFLCISLFANAKNMDNMKEDTIKEGDKLVVVWSSADPLVAERMVLMYSHASKRNGWWDDVTIVIWGPSAKLIAEDDKIQIKLKLMMEDGIEIRACKACSDAFGTTKKLEELGYDVTYMGEPLTSYLKSDAKVITF